jgi:hypothetical protein
MSIWTGRILKKLYSKLKEDGYQGCLPNILLDEVGVKI